MSRSRYFAKKSLCVSSLLALLSLGAVPALAQGQGQGQGQGRPPSVRGAQPGPRVVPFVFEGDVRDLPRAPEWRPGDPIKEIPRRGRRPPGPERQPPTPRVDPLLQVQENAPRGEDQRAFTTPGVDTNGQGFTGVQPPDTVGDVGPNFYIQSINGSGGSVFTIRNKTTGAVVAGPTTMDSLGSGNCATGAGDPVVLYDELAGRWLLSEFSSAGNRLCVYVSQTGDPVSGGWFNYDFQAPSFPDYPKYGVWPDAYYVGTNESSPTVYALDRNQMLAGQPASSQRFTASSLSGFGFQMITPADLDGSTAPPAGSPAYFMRHRDDESHGGSTAQDFLEIFEFSVDWVTPANSTFTGPVSIAVTEFDSNLCGLTSFNCVPQPGTATTLDPLREVVMFRLGYRNFGSHETLVGNFVTDVNGSDRHGIRWFELRKSGAGAWSLHQEGTWSPDATNRWMGAIAMDQDGNIALGYNVSSSSVSPGLRYTGRLSTDTLGTMSQGETTLEPGGGSNTSNRYGDYAAMGVDPADGCTFWFTGEYNPTSQWSTRIGSFKFDSCGGGGCTPQPIANAGPDQTICLGDSALIGTAAQAGHTYSWTPGGATSAQVNVSPTATTIYTVSATTTCGSAQDSVTVTVDTGSGGGINEDFEGDTSAWAATGLWHKTASSSCANPGYSSPVNAFYYGQDGTCNYDTGAANTGTLTSPSVTATATSTLSFDYYRVVESFNGDYDRTRVEIVTGTGATTVWSRNASDASAGAWTPSGSIDLSSFAGQSIQVRFVFDTVDGTANNFTGWFIDDVVVTADSQCSPPPVCTIDSQCDDGLFCNGAETCNTGTGTCEAGTAPNCNDGVSCTVDSCNEGTDSCDNTPNDAVCDNGLFCDGAETCNAVLDCQAGTPVNCNDGVSCTVDSCNEGTDSCDNTPNDALCDNGLFCDGAETCNATLDCQAGTDPCGGGACDEVGDTCPGGQNGPQVAVYDAGLGAPKCAVAGSECDSTTLLDSRGNLSPAESNQPNTIDTCADGSSGTYHGDESNDRLVVATLDGNDFVEGATVEVRATVWAWSTGSSDSLDLYYAADANNPSWILIGTLSPPAGGAQTLTTQYTLPTGSMQAVRANFRYQGTQSSCSGGAYDDADDLVFAVKPGVPSTCTLDDDFEGGTAGWVNDAASTCTTGAYVAGNPTNPGGGQQIVGSHSGATSLFTGVNTAAGTDDVDGGNCILGSPTWSVATASTLSVWYWHGQRDAADDPSGDFFRLEYSTNGGTSWSTIASVGDVASTAAWTEATASVPAGSNVKVRVQCSDGTAGGDLVECGIDDVSICSP